MRRQREEGRQEIGYEPHRAYHPIHIHILQSSISLLYFSSSHLRPWGSQICPGQIGQVSQHQRGLQRRRRHLIGPNVTHDRQTHGRSADGRTTSPRSRAMPPRRMGLPAFSTGVSDPDSLLLRGCISLDPLKREGDSTACIIYGAS